MGYSSNGKSKYISEINVTPFVDVMLVLLIIFMVTAPMMMQGENVELPQAGSENISNETVEWVISVTKDGKIFFNDNQVESDYLENFLRDKVTGKESEPQVFIKGDKNVSYGVIIKVMSQVKSAGIEKVGMITTPVSVD
ncbi:MAG: protein TolR [Thermodesulfobacteriota bacterium]